MLHYSIYLRLTNFSDLTLRRFRDKQFISQKQKRKYAAEKITSALQLLSSL